MPDIREQSARPSAGFIGTPAIGVRNDVGGDISGANLNEVQFQFNSAGSHRTTSEGGLATYRTILKNVAPVAGNTVTIAGSSTKTVKVRKVRITGGLATAVSYIDVQVVKQS